MYTSTETMDFKAEKRIYDIHSAFLHEYSQAKIGLSEFYEAVTSFFFHVSLKNEDKLSECFDEDIGSIQDICFFLKTFCSEIELHTQLLKSKAKDEITDPDVVEEQLDVSDIEYKLPENPNEIYPYELYPEIFTYLTIDPAEFKVGLEYEFFISYIKDETNIFFFMMKPSCPEIIIEKPEFRYDTIPSKGTVFGLLLDGVIFRAVRENLLKSQPKSFKVLLIDFGEIIEITKDYKLFRLDEQMQQIPGQLIFCKLNENDDENADNENFLRDKLHTKQNIRIDRAYKNMLEVSFVTPKASVESSSGKTRTSSSDLSTMPRNQGCLPPPPSVPNNRNDSLTQEELDELYEEPFSTDNALVAVMGYAPQDDKRICKFFDPKTNACFKGSHCKLQHTTKLKDGWTKDQRIAKLTIHAQMPLPKVGRKINLFVQFVVDVDTFYGHIIPKDCKSADELPAERIFNEMNTADMKCKFKKFLYPPEEHELVFALFNGDWYRAKVMRKLSNIQYKVFFVDYGNCYCVALNEMRLWEDTFDCHPFQAIECKLDNIKKLKDKDPTAISRLEKLIFRQTVTATVTSNVGPLLVTVQYQNIDVGEQVCAAQFAVSKPITRFANGNLPG